jgi:hypothetical protein
MVIQEKLYQSILLRLSMIPVDYLEQIDLYLKLFSKKVQSKQRNRAQILALAGSWNEMTEVDFQDYLHIAHQTGQELFNREIAL